MEKGTPLVWTERPYEVHVNKNNKITPPRENPVPPTQIFKI